MRRNSLFLSLSLILGLTANAAIANTGKEYLTESYELFKRGLYFNSARYAFQAQEEDSTLTPEAVAHISVSLVRAKLYQSASYFFIRTLQTGRKDLIKRVLLDTEDLMLRVGPDLFRKYLIENTTFDDYDSINRSAYLFALAKKVLFDAPTSGDATSVSQVIGYVDGMSKDSPLYPHALQLRGVAQALLNDTKGARQSFEACKATSGRLKEWGWSKESEDLKTRCQAGLARSFYEEGLFLDAERAYDRIPKESLVWPDILFEQAWNAYSLGQMNHTLGKLVSYKAPILEFVYNPEIEVLRAQAYYSLCLYQDAGRAMDEFSKKYTPMGEQIRNFVEKKDRDLSEFFNLGKEALKGPMASRKPLHQLVNRFVRGPYFQDLVQTDKSLVPEFAMIEAFSGTQEGFSGFLREVLKWRKRTVATLGGIFVKNSLIDYHQELISDFDKVSFIKLELLKKLKDQLMHAPLSGGPRSRGEILPERRDDQYYWGFNGEFWNDELGDYVFGLKSECGR